MSSNTLQTLFEAGGANIQYAFTVGGYPWACTTTRDLADALNLAGNTAIRRAIFGEAESSTGVCFADDPDLCHSFPILKQPGKQTWTVHPGQGKLAGGGFDVEIYDVDLGHTWPHSSNSFRGIEGIHRVAQPRLDPGIGWGFLADNFGLAADVTQPLIVRDGNITQLKSRIDAAEQANTFHLLWIGQECVAAESCTLTGGYLTISIYYSETARGVLRTRKQRHWNNRVSGISKIVTDVPLSVVNKIGYVWAIPLNIDGTIMYDDSSDPLCGLVRWGQISTDISTKKGMTKISVLSPFEQMNNDVTEPLPVKANLARYVFSRQDTAGTSYPDPYIFGTWEQSPHLVLHEASYNDDGTIWESRYIWLCEQGETVEFDTAEEVIEALVEELGYVYSATDGINHLQVSGDGSTGNDYVRCAFKYRFQDGKLVFDAIDTDPGTRYLNTVMAAGPLAILLNLGDPIIGQGAEIVIEALQNPAKAGGIFNLESTSQPSRSESTGNLEYHWRKTPTIPILDLRPSNLKYSKTIDEDYKAWSEWTSTHVVWEPTHQFRTPYFYSFDWQEEDFTLTDSSNSPLRKPQDSVVVASTKLWFQPGSDIDDLTAWGEKMMLGNPDSKYYAKLTVSGSGEDGLYSYVTFSGNTLNSLYGFTNKLWYGQALFSPLDVESYYVENPGDVRPTSVGSIQPVTSISGLTYDRNTAVVNELDRWIVRQVYVDSPVDQKLSNLFKGLFGGTGLLELSDRFKQHRIAGFLTEDDFVSCVDWDDLDAKAEKLTPDHKYRVDITNGYNIGKMFSSELLLHGICPTWEWDNSSNQFMMRFRSIGPMNGTAAISEGRTIEEKNILVGAITEETHNDTWLYNRIEVNCNKEDSEYKGHFIVKYEDGQIANVNEQNTLKIESDVSFVPFINNLSSTEAQDLYKIFSERLYNLSSPNPQYKTTLDITRLPRVALGREAVITDRAGRVPYDHGYGFDEMNCLVNQITYDLDKNTMAISATIGNYVAYGWAPAVHVAADSSTKTVGNHTIACTCTAHAFSAPTGRLDCSWFNCLDWSKSDGIYRPRACSCSDYSVIAFTVKTGWSPTLMYFDVTNVDTATGTMTLADKSGGAYANYTNWDVTHPHVIIFSTWNAVQPCQKNFVCFADDDNTLGTAGDMPRRWQ
jgi:hypothetical protein